MTDLITQHNVCMAFLATGLQVSGGSAGEQVRWKRKVKEFRVCPQTTSVMDFIQMSKTSKLLVVAQKCTATSDPVWKLTHKLIRTQEQPVIYKMHVCLNVQTYTFLKSALNFKTSMN